jgi:predicted RNase H-like nuclease (RuvC/YqgF family)
MSDKGKSIYGLDKIPTEKLLKASRIEVGELKSYIDELLYDKEVLNNEINQLKLENKKLRSLNKKELKEIKQQDYIKKKDEEIKDLKSKLAKLSVKYDALFSQSLIYQKE